ncbi:MAG: Zn-ribbon domain-containing OB-fold protein [Thermomicrobiales bacterium]
MSDSDRQKAPERPLPAPEDELNAQFWEHCGSGKLCFQRCTQCGAWRHLPRFLCADCGSGEWQWEESSGRGCIYTWTVTHQAPMQAFAGATPYAAVVVELEEGVRLVSGVRDLQPNELSIGLPVEVVFEPVSETMLIPLFRRRST